MQKIILWLLTVNSLFAPCFLFKRRFKRSSNIKASLPIHQQYFMQKLDHFDRGNNEKWPQRFFALPAYYKQGGPAFLFVNGEYSMDIDSVLHYAGHRMAYAEELNAYCFSLEHRFYGKSWPANGNIIRHLSSEQALADIANFIQGATKSLKLPEDINWIVFGCSYAGALAAWSRLKYPHLIHGAVASSAVMLAKADFPEYLQVVEESLKAYHPKCVESISLANKEIVSLNKTEEDRKNATKAFFSCTNKVKETDEHFRNIFLFMESILTEAVQYHNTAKINISTVCDLMMNNNSTKYQNYAKLKELYDQSVDADDDDDTQTNRVSWTYQTCSEFGFFQRTSKELTLFAGVVYDSLEYLTKECRQFFGPKFSIEDLNEKVRHTNTIYGGLNFNVANTLFIHGSLDPWHVLGLHTRKNDSLYQTIFINETSHCADGNSASEEDIQPLKDARNEILDILKIWLGKKST